MIFCGDTVFPLDSTNNTLSLDKDFQNKPKIINLEALIVEDLETKITTEGIALNNHNKVISFLNNLNVKAVSLANNHITDYDISITKQKESFEREDIEVFGAGNTLNEAKVPFKYKENNQEFAVLTFGWSVIGCQYANDNTRGVNPMKYENILTQVEALKKEKNIKIILNFHCNYEFELYPQPAHRAMFFNLIDLGVDAIICHHPHIVGGYEEYQGHPIFYSLGNFYFPETNYNGYNLKHKKEAREGLSVEYDGITENIKLYWTNKAEDNVLKITKTEYLSQSEKIKSLTPFSGMNHKEYILWFKKNRLKNKLLPIYKNFQSSKEEWMKNFFMDKRQKIINYLVRKGLK